MALNRFSIALIVSISISLLLTRCSDSRRVVKLAAFGSECETRNDTRIYLNDTVFVSHSHWRGFDSTLIDTFKVVRGSWFKKVCGAYMNYFNSISFENGDTLLVFDSDCRWAEKRIPIETVVKNDALCYRYKIYQRDTSPVGGELLFDPQVGIIEYSYFDGSCNTWYLKLLSDEKLTLRQINELTPHSP